MTLNSTDLVRTLSLRDLLVGLGLFLAILGIYFAAGTVYISAPDPTNEIEMKNAGLQDQFQGLDCFSVNDSSAVIFQSLSLISEGNITFRAVEVPQMFDWTINGMAELGPIPLPAIDDRIRDWINAGTLIPARHHPQVVDTTTPGLYMSCFGMGGALTATPAFAVGQAVFGPLNRLPDVLDRLAFTEGSLLTAASAFFLYLALVGPLSRSAALLLAVAYAIGTCVFSTSSQGMWQHSATAFFSGIALVLLTRLNTTPLLAYPLGICMAMATLSRPTMGVIAGALALQFLITDRRAFLRYACAGLPFAVLLLYANYALLGSPFVFGQTALVDHAVEKTGVAKIWQTPPHIGIAGLLFSPSRGLFVYSPFLLASVAGAIAVWRTKSWAWLRGISLALPAIIFLESNHFDWWGGWSFGYRHLVDLSIFIVALIGPVAGAILQSTRLKILFLLAIAFSIGVQIIGVTSNDVWRWNAPVVYLLQDDKQKTIRETSSYAEFDEWISQPKHTGNFEVRNIDRVPFRPRLWSIKDSQLVYYFKNFKRGVRARQAQLWNARQSQGRKVAAAYRNLALAYAKAGAIYQSTACIQWAYDADPGYQDGLLTAWDLISKTERGVGSIAGFLQQRTLTAPSDDAAHIYLGFVFIEKGDVVSAIREFEDVLRHSPSDFKRRFTLGKDFFTKRVRDGLAIRPNGPINRDLRLVTSVMDLAWKATQEENIGNYAKATEIYRDIAKILPQAPNLSAHQARLLLKEGKQEEAWSILRSNTTAASTP